MANKLNFFLIFIWLYFKWLFKYLPNSFNVTSLPLNHQIYTIWAFKREFTDPCLILLSDAFDLNHLHFFVMSSHKLLPLIEPESLENYEHE